MFKREKNEMIYSDEKKKVLQVNLYGEFDSFGSCIV